MALQDVTPATPETFKALQLDGTAAQMDDVIAAIDASLTGGSILGGRAEGLTDAGVKRWRVRVIPANGDEQVGEPGNWFVVSSLGPVFVMLDAEYKARFGISA